MYIINKLVYRKDLPYILTTIMLGTLNHFLYEWSGEMAIAALSSPINESVWEHLKLLFFPFLVITLWTYYHQKLSDLTRYFSSRLFAVLIGMLFIITSYYTYTGILGTHFLTIDIGIFIISVFLTYYASHIFYKKAVWTDDIILVTAGWVLLLLCFFFFTCSPPNIPLFFPPG